MYDTYNLQFPYPPTYYKSLLIQSKYCSWSERWNCVVLSTNTLLMGAAEMLQAHEVLPVEYIAVDTAPTSSQRIGNS